MTSGQMAVCAVKEGRGKTDEQVEQLAVFAGQTA